MKCENKDELRIAVKEWLNVYNQTSMHRVPTALEMHAKRVLKEVETELKLY